MNITLLKSGISYVLLLLVNVGFSLVLAGCDNNEEIAAINPSPATEVISNTSVIVQPAIETVETKTGATNQQTQFNIGNKSYLFDVSNHTVEEMNALLARAREISQLDSENYKDLQIVMILHGPDIDWFTQQNTETNKELISLAAELDKLDIIDMKVCETAMNKRGIRREDIPAFIESVPYAPDEMQKLLQEGFINL